MKKFYKLTFILFIIIGTNFTAFPQLPGYLPTDSLKAWYPFNGNANDISGNNMNGTLHGTTIAFISGLYNQAIQFNNVNFSGLFDINDYVQLPNFTLNNFSISYWFKYHANACLQNHSCCTFSLGEQTGLGYAHYLETNGILHSSNLSFIDTVQYDTWYHVVVVINDTIETFYLNGIPMASVYIQIASHNFVYHPAYVAIHTWYGGGSSSSRYNGLIDNLGIWNRPLTLCEVYQLYTGIIQSNPTVNLGNDTTICQGQSKTLAVGSGYTSYLWSTGATTQQITIQNTGTYWVKAISNQGCTVRDTINLTFLPVQSNILRDTILCLGQSVIFNPGVVYTNHLWSTGATNNSLNVSLPGTFWLQAKQANGCMIRDTVVVKYDSLSVSIASFANPSCFGGSNGSINTTISSLYPPFTFSWNTTPVLTTQNLSNLSAGNYILTLTDSLGCIKTASQTLTAPTPVVISLGNDTSFCQGQSIVLQATQIFASYLWSTGASTQSINVNTQGAYWLKGTNASGCSGYDTINVTLNTTPVVQITPANPSICKGEFITLTASSNLAATTYTWSNAALTSTVNLSPTITTSYFVIGKFNQCVDTTFATITVKQLPIISTTADKNPICEGESTNLTAGSNMPSTTYVWNNNVTGNTLSVAPTNSAYYYVTGTASNCHDTSGITINVINQQSINLGVDDYLCVGDEKTLYANNLLGVFLWSNGTSGNIMIVNEPGVFWLKVDNNGCISSDTIVLKPCSEIWVPNVFTPNNDGINDIFKAKTKEIQKLQLYIYNRWGNMVFETKDINMGWDGKYAGGDAQSGVYYWLIRYNENRSSNQNVEKEIHGSVTLLR